MSKRARSESRRQLLLLNTTNHPLRRAYPYAFVQVSEVAGRHDVDVRRVDLYDVPQQERRVFLAHHLAAFVPDLVGITLRNTDSLLSSDYLGRVDDSNYAEPFQLNLVEQLGRGAPAYFPTHDTRDLVALVRSLVDVPIVVGGFGFSTQPVALLRFLDADFGVFGAADGFFARLDDVLRGRDLGSVPNLLFRVGDTVREGPRQFFGPSDRREYDEEIIRDRDRFIGARGMHLPATSRAIPIEVMRGCPFSCSFCAEPLVKGKRAMVRDLDVVEEELALLRRHHLNSVWFVCSEINAAGNGFVTELAERMIRINERRSEGERLTWYTYYLLKFDVEMLRLLRRSGFAGGWNDVPSFADDNLSQLRVPYRARALLAGLSSVRQVADEERRARGERATSIEERIFGDPEHRQALLPADMLASPILTLFLGNQSATVETVRDSLRVLDESGLASSYDAAYLVRAERVFSYNATWGTDAATTVSFEPAQEEGGAEGTISPTFRFPPALVDHFGSIDALERFFVHVEDTYCSQNHRFKKNWTRFVGQHLGPTGLRDALLQTLERGVRPSDGCPVDKVAQFLEHVCSKPDAERVALLLHPADGRQALSNLANDFVLRALKRARAEELRPVLAWLGLSHDVDAQVTSSDYQVAVAIHERFETREALHAAFTDAFDSRAAPFELLSIEEPLFRHGVLLHALVRPFFVPTGRRAAPPSPKV